MIPSWGPAQPLQPLQTSSPTSDTQSPARPGALASAGTGGLSSSILGFTSSYASSKAPRGMSSKGSQAGTRYALDSPGLPCGGPFSSSFWLRAGLSFLDGSSCSQSPETSRLAGTASFLRGDADADAATRGEDEPCVRPVGPGPPPPAFLSWGPLEGAHMGVRPQSKSARLAPSMGGEGDRSLALEGTGDLLGEAERGWEQTGTVTPHTGMPARQDQRLLCPRGKGLLDRGCLQRRVGASAGSTWEAGPGAGRARRPVHPHRGQRDVDARLGAPGRLPGCITCPRLSQDLRFLCLRGPGQRGRRSGEGHRPPHTLCRPV